MNTCKLLETILFEMVQFTRYLPSGNFHNLYHCGIILCSCISQSIYENVSPMKHCWMLTNVLGHFNFFSWPYGHTIPQHFNFIELQRGWWSNNTPVYSWFSQCHIQEGLNISKEWRLCNLSGQSAYLWPSSILKKKKKCFVLLKQNFLHLSFHPLTFVVSMMLPSLI